MRTKLVQQSIEELTRRVEMSENRVANMSMRVETKQNTFERRVDHIRQLLESCHRQLLANHLLVELLRGNNSNSNNTSKLLLNNKKLPKQKIPRYNSQTAADRFTVTAVQSPSSIPFPVEPVRGNPTSPTTNTVPDSPMPQIKVSDYGVKRSNVGTYATVPEEPHAANIFTVNTNLRSRRMSL